MSVLATDNFNRADSADIGTNWDTITGESALKILSNVVDSDGLDGSESYNAVTWPSDQYSQATLVVTGGTAGGGNGPGVALRMATGSRTYYRIVANDAASNNIEIGKFNTAYGLLGQLTSAWSSGDVLKVSISGSSPGTISVYKNGAFVGSATDSAIASGRAGISYSSTTTTHTIDNWEGGDLSASEACIPKRIPNRFVRPVALIYKFSAGSVIQRYYDVPAVAASPFIFKKTLSSIGTKTGSHQTQNS